MSDDEIVHAYEVRFLGGPYDGRQGTMPILPTFITAHEQGGCEATSDGKILIDWSLHDSVYLLTFPQGEDGPCVYVYRAGINLLETVREPKLRELPPTVE